MARCYMPCNRLFWIAAVRSVAFVLRESSWRLVTCSVRNRNQLWTISGRAWRATCAAVLGMRRLAMRSRQQQLKGMWNEIRSGRLRTGCARKFVGGRVTVGGKAGRVAADRGRDGCYGAVRSGQAFGAKAG